jgi:hypothetical protein
MPIIFSLRGQAGQGLITFLCAQSCPVNYSSDLVSLLSELSPTSELSSVCSLPIMSKKSRSFKTFEQDLARSQSRLGPQIVEGTQTRYAEHVTFAAGSSTTSRSILPLPTQPLLLQAPLAKEPELVVPDAVPVPENEQEKEKTQVCSISAQIYFPLNRSLACRRQNSLMNLKLHFHIY